MFHYSLKAKIFDSKSTCTDSCCTQGRSKSRSIKIDIICGTSQAKNVDELLTALIQCDVIAYDVSTSDGEVEACLLACNGSYNVHHFLLLFKLTSRF